VCRKYYVHPALFAAYERGITFQPPRTPASAKASTGDPLAKLEAKLLRLLNGGSTIGARRRQGHSRKPPRKLAA
jgi:hypothetical protein